MAALDLLGIILVIFVILGQIKSRQKEAQHFDSLIESLFPLT